jgi:phospholipase/carboxylesterase
MPPRDLLPTMTRRDFLTLAGAAGTVSCLGGIAPVSAAGPPRLTARPAPPTSGVAPGEHSLGSRGNRDGILYVPKGHDSTVAAPLAVMLHGAGNSSKGMTFTFALADEFGVIIIAPDSRQLTWDVVRGTWGADVEFIDQALRQTFAQCAVDPARIAVGGFSDGASYALSLGMANGDLFNHVMAFSPGFIAAAPPVSKPKIFISHGRQDRILLIDTTSRLIVPQLTALGYDVHYQEFDGPHAVPPAIAHDAFEWFTTT